MTRNNPRPKHKWECNTCGNHFFKWRMGAHVGASMYSRCDNCGEKKISTCIEVIEHKSPFKD